MKLPFDIPAISITNGSHSKFPTMQVVAHVIEGFKVPFKDNVLSHEQLPYWRGGKSAAWRERGENNTHQQAAGASDALEVSAVPPTPAFEDSFLHHRRLT